MAILKINGDTSGSVSLTVPATAGTNTATVPAQTGTLGMMAQGTAVASTSGTAIDFTGIPSWVKRITVMFSGVSASGTSNLIVQLGTSGGVVTSGYLGSVTITNGGTTTNFSSGFIIANALSAVDVYHGQIIINNLTSNTWCESSYLGFSSAAATRAGAGSVSLSGVLDRIRITTVGGTDTFDAGSINILYEG